MSDLLQTTLNTLAIGGLYALIALGYTLVYGILRFINFAHSDIVAWGGWIAFTVASAAGWLAAGGTIEWVPLQILNTLIAFAAIGGAAFVLLDYLSRIALVKLPPQVARTVTLGTVGAVLLALLLGFGLISSALPLVLVCTMAVCATLGVSIEFLAYRPLRKAPRLNVLITAIGVSLFLQNVGYLERFFGNRPTTMSALLTNHVLVTVAGVGIRLYDVLTIVLAITLALMLERLVYRTRMGRAMRAVSFDERTAALMGINVNVIISVTFAIGSALAAVGGILFALRNDLRMTADASWVLLGLKAFVAAVVGGIGNVRGAAAGALLIAFVEQFVHFYVMKLYEYGVGEQAPVWVGQLQDVYVFGILILVLMFKPSGLLGKAVVEKV